MFYTIGRYLVQSLIVLFFLFLFFSFLNSRENAKINRYFLASRLCSCQLRSTKPFICQVSLRRVLSVRRGAKTLEQITNHKNRPDLAENILNISSQKTATDFLRGSANQ